MKNTEKNIDGILPPHARPKRPTDGSMQLQITMSSNGKYHIKPADSGTELVDLEPISICCIHSHVTAGAIITEFKLRIRRPKLKP